MLSRLRPRSVNDVLAAIVFFAPVAGGVAARNDRRPPCEVGMSGERRFLLGAVLALALSLSLASTADAATGDVLRHIVAANPESCSVNVGVAFDGHNLLVSCVSPSVTAATKIDYVKPADGSVVKSLTVNLNGVAAMAYDANRNKIWACNAPAGNSAVGTDVYLIDPSTGVATFEFSAAGCWDGLAYDGSDDSLWMSPDQSDTIYHYSSSGTLLGSHSGIATLLGGHGNSGIAVGGPRLFLSNADGHQIYSAPKDLSSATLLATESQHLEDMECDSVTFAPKGAIWIIDAFTRDLYAYEIPAGTCGVGGKPVPPPQAPSADLSIRKAASARTTSVGRTFSYTLHVTNHGPSSAQNVVVSDTLPSRVAFVSDSTSQGSCSGSTKIKCSLGTLATSASATIDIAVRAKKAGTAKNKASIASSTHDPNAANNSSTATTTINGPPRLRPCRRHHRGANADQWTIGGRRCVNHDTYNHS